MTGTAVASRASGPRRIVVTGGESTGKTTLARLLAARLAVPWSPEHARVYAEAAGRPLGAHDVEPIARGQRTAEDAAIAEAHRLGADLVVHDTDLASTVVYARHYYGEVPAWIRDAAWRRRGDLYLLCAPDLPWEADGVRDRPTERDAMHDRFAALLGELGVPVRAVSGIGEARLEAALDAIRTLSA